MPTPSSMSSSRKPIQSPPGAPSAGTGPGDQSRLDSPPPPPPSLSDKSADPSMWQGPAGQGTPPTGQLEQVVIEHAMLAEQLLTSIGKMLPSFVPIAAQIQSSMRTGIMQALKAAAQSPQTSLAAGSAPPNPPPPPLPPQGAAPPGGPAGAMAPPPGQAAAAPAGAPQQ